MVVDVRQTLDHCIKCNICTTACPVARVTDLFPGPKYVGPQAQRFREERSPTVDLSVDYCSGCGVCDLACPHGVKIQEINAKAKGKLWSEDGVPLRNRLLGRAELMGALGSGPLAPLSNLAMENPLLRLVLEKVIGIDRRAPLPRFSPTRFRDWIARRGAGIQKFEGRVAYFHGCSTQHYEPRVGQAAIAVLEHHGFYVEAPKQNCCGLPMLSNGEFNAARAYARRNVDALLPFAEAGVPIVGTSTSCTLSLKHDWPVILDMTDADTRLVAGHTYDILEFLWLLWQEGQLRSDFQPLEKDSVYHAPCQQRAHGMGHPALDLLSLVPGFRAHESQADCCGIAGTYGYKREKYQIAMDVGRPLFRRIRELGSDVALCDSETCRWQITHGSGVRALHPIEILAASYGVYIPPLP